MFFSIMFYNFNTKTLIASIPYDVTMPFLTKEKISNEQITNEIEKFYTKGLKSADDGSVINAFTQVKKILQNLGYKEAKSKGIDLNGNNGKRGYNIELNTI